MVVDRHRVGRTGSSVERDVLRLVAELYYERDLRQPEIATLTGFSVSKVSRLLSQARESGVVTIAIERSTEGRPALARELEARFGVDIAITPGRETDPPTAARLCGLGAAAPVVDWLPERGVLGVTGGLTMDALASALPRLDRPDIVVVPVVGGWDARNRYLDVNELARRIADRLGGQPRFLHAPGIVDSVAVKEALLADSAVAGTTRLWSSIDLALLGIGGAPTAHPGYGTIMDRLDDLSRRSLADLGIVGDVGGHFFRADGSLVDNDWTRRTLVIDTDQLRRIPRVVGVSAGPGKVTAVLGALRSGLLGALVTDRPTAEGVLRADDRQARQGVPRR
jgi:DNA-binding transcriptional regulator LsrR (DeoR family)